MSSKFFRRSNNNNANANLNNRADFSERKAQLSPLEYRVTQERETERPFSNKYNKHWETGTYHCIVCDTELFTSSTKFESKSGWPAFYNVVDPKKVKLTADLSHIGANLLLLIAKPDLARTEVSCGACNAHLGHLFKDGPKPTGLRYCINSASLSFVPDHAPGTNSADHDHTQRQISNENTDAPAEPSPPREFACNPENTCARATSVTGTGAEKNANSAIKGGTLPPMASLCLRNQPCQRRKEKDKKSQSMEELLDKPTPVALAAEPLPLFEKCTSYKKTAEPETEKPRPPQPRFLPLAPRASSVRYGSSKGVSLTAARIEFFQNLNQQPHPSGRFVGSLSSGSIGLRGRSTGGSGPATPTSTEDNPILSKINNLNRRNSPAGLMAFPLNQMVTKAPHPLKETEL